MDIEDAMERVAAGHVIARQAWRSAGMILRPSSAVLPDGSRNWISTVDITWADSLAEDWMDLGALH